MNKEEISDRILELRLIKSKLYEQGRAQDALAINRELEHLRKVHSDNRRTDKSGTKK